ncbi:hypothetical protein [Streptomyces monashensis]|nr:hypothetical protein [Streptomyces monashensis]
MPLPPVPQVQVEERERVRLLDPYGPGRIEGADPILDLLVGLG